MWVITDIHVNDEMRYTVYQYDMIDYQYQCYHTLNLKLPFENVSKDKIGRFDIMNLYTDLQLTIECLSNE